jgi:hypothetical protein
VKKALLLLILCCFVTLRSEASVWYGVNYDAKTVAAMVAAYGTETATEKYYSEQVQKILDRYSAAEVASAGIFMSKYLDRKAMTELGVWSSRTENYYYRRIYSLVSSKIMPKVWRVAQMMVRSPQTALYWGSYLYKICAEVETLCMQFESVVTNSTLTFSDVVFLQIAPEYQALFSLVQSGDIDWQQLLDDMGGATANMSRENLKADIDHLYSMGVGIANAGSENMMNAVLGGNSFHEVMTGKISTIAGAVESSYRLYQQLEGNLGGTVLRMLGGADNVSRLFQIDSYNMTSWMTDYLRETLGQYYTQRWYIYRKEAGSEVLCDYVPPTDNNSILSGGEWVRFTTTDTGFTPSADQNKQILNNSAQYAGWSPEKVQQMNAAHDGYTYSISYSRYGYTISKSGKQTKKAYAYSIKVSRSWNRTEEVYEALFDSYSMDLATFQRQLQVRLAEYNDNEAGYTYYIGSDAKNYYTATNETKLKGSESVILSVTCHDGYTLAEGTTQYKCSQCGSSVNSHTKECAMSTSLSDSQLDTSEMDALEAEYNSRITTLQTEISRLTAANESLVKQIATSSIEEAVPLRQQYNENKTQIEKLNRELATVQQQLADLQSAKEEASAGESEETDDYYRIPAIMNDCKTAFDLKWSDAGSWSGSSYIRKATSGNMNAEITFKATVSIARKPKYFLGIKIHRAIVEIAWALTAEATDTQVVDVLQLDQSKTDRENAQLVNNRISEIARQYPACTVSTEYIKNEPDEAAENQDTYHLLWSSDRLEIARQIDTRLTRIYADLVMLEKMMNCKLSILNVLMQYTPSLHETQGKKQSIAEKAHSRWLYNAAKTSSSPLSDGGNQWKGDEE